jgi:hypothetical protein
MTLGTHLFVLLKISQACLELVDGSNSGSGDDSMGSSGPSVYHGMEKPSMG